MPNNPTYALPAADAADGGGHVPSRNNPRARLLADLAVVSLAVAQGRWADAAGLVEESILPRLAEQRRLADAAGFFDPWTEGGGLC